MVQYYNFMMHKVKFLYRTDYLIARLQLFKFKCINLFLLNSPTIYHAIVIPFDSNSLH